LQHCNISTGAGCWCLTVESITQSTATREGQTKSLIQTFHNQNN